MQNILYEAEDGVALITLHRPERLNALTPGMRAELKAAMRTASEDPEVRAIVLTGAGRGFCSGADVSELQNIRNGRRGASRDEDPFDAEAREDFHSSYAWFPAVPLPIITAINGPCAGVGFVLALYSDLRFASDQAAFTTGYSSRGLIAEHGVDWLLPRIVGMGHAADLLYSSRKIHAHEAAAMGLVNRIVPHTDLLPAAMAYAHKLAREVSPRSVREIKKSLWTAQFQTLGEAIATSYAALPACFASEDFEEGVAHFVQKRPPTFTGR